MIKHKEEIDNDADEEIQNTDTNGMKFVMQRPMSTTTCMFVS